MAITPFRKQGGGTEDELRKQSNSEAVFNSLRGVLILDGTLVEDVAVGTSETLVAHKLGRPIRGYFVCKNNTLCTVANTSGTFDKTLFIGLVASSACTLSLWVF